MNVPRLRFKEFSENWEIKKLGDIAENLQSGKSKERNENGDFILYGSTGAIGFCNQFEHEGKNILIARVGANAGYLYEVDGNYCVSDNTLILHLKYPNNYSFFYNLLRHINLNKLVFGSGQPLITGGQLKVLNIFVPSFPEQTKIASFLTAVDEKIAQLAQKADLLARYKKGVMQQIFSQQLRFKDDDRREFPDWEEKKLKDLVLSPITYGVVKPGDYDINGVKLIRGGDILQGKINKNLRTITKEISQQYQRTILQGGELLVSLGACPKIEHSRKLY